VLGFKSSRSDNAAWWFGLEKNLKTGGTVRLVSAC
jgi:hypothetical protein